ncbi:MAG: DsrE family protein [Proteobacteria bacterium]|nr:DsrE family protein [Pseudomonadota bacterium]
MLGASLIGLQIAGATAGAADKKVHHVAIQVDENDVAKINLALNNASNVAQYYGEKGEQVEIEIVAYGPGLHMLREDTMTPGIRDRLKSFTQSLPDVVFAACENTRANMAKAEGKKTADIPIIKGAKLVPSGVVRLMELQEQGWSYIRP